MCCEKVESNTKNYDRIQSTVQPDLVKVHNYLWVLQESASGLGHFFIHELSLPFSPPTPELNETCFFCSHHTQILVPIISPREDIYVYLIAKPQEYK